MASDYKHDEIIEEKHEGLQQGLLFKGDNCGHYEWKIKDTALIRKIMKAEAGEKIESPEFIMANLPWLLRLYPNGNRETARGNVNVVLKFVSMPLSIKEICFTYSLYIKETASSITTLDTIQESNEGWSIPDGVLLTSHFRALNLREITIVACVKIASIHLKTNSNYWPLCNLNMTNINKKDYHNTTTHKHNITKQTMKMMKNSWNGRRFESPLIDNMWKMIYYPNGDMPTDKGLFQVWL